MFPLAGILGVIALDDKRGFTGIICASLEEEPMRPLLALCAALLFVASTILGCATGSSESGWITLVDGTAKSLANFNAIGDANWRAEGGAIVARKGKGGHLVSKKSYKDFQIYAEFWAEQTTNSGIFIRGTQPQKVGTDTAYEVNIFDQRPDPTYGTGAIVGVAEVNPMPKAGGKWNTYEITAKGRQISVVLNGQKTVELHNGLFSEGNIALQHGSGVIKFRKAAIKPL